MQKQTMFQSFIKKKQLITKMLTETKCFSNKEQFKHFQALSEPVYMKAETNAIYLTHLNGEFKDQLRQFVREQETFSETIFQLAQITECLEGEKSEVESQYRKVRDRLNEVQLDKEVLSDKSDLHLRKILALQDQAKTLQVMGEENQKAATSLQQEIEYQTCMLSQIRSRNTQILSQLQTQTTRIEHSTSKMQSCQKQIRQKQSHIKKLNQEIKSIYFTLESQDDQLNLLCTSIQNGLNKQNNCINDIEFVKDGLKHVLVESESRKRELRQAEEVRDRLLEYGDDLQWELKKIEKQLEIQDKGIQDECWKIEQEKQRLQQNHQMLAEIQFYLQDLINKNQLLEQSLEQQIIQDHTIKKIVESKTQQPVGRKTKQFLEQLQEKELAETSSSWNCKENSTSYKEKSRVSGLMSPKEKRQFVQREVENLARKRGPQQMEFVFEKFIHQKQDEWTQEFELQQQKERQNFMRKQQDHYMSTGFTYIDKLTRLESEV